jgi:hypothetical protein
MKEQIKTTTASNRPAGFLRRGALKLLLAAFVVLGSIGTPTQARAQIVDPGTGILPPEPQEVVTRGYRPKQKSTKITDPTPVFMVQNGSTITLKARLWFLNAKNKWQPMNYKRVPMQFFVGSNWMGTAKTDKKGWASVTLKIQDTRYISSRGKRVNWRVYFAGDIELKRSPSASGTFVLLP